MAVFLLTSIVLLRVTDSCLLKFLGKNYIHTKSAHFLFEAVTFAIGAALFLCVGGSVHVASDTLMHGTILGIVAVTESICTLAALGCGSMALTMIISTSAMIIPIILARPLWGDTLSVGQLVGTIVMLLSMAIILNVKDVIKKESKLEEKNPQHKKWLVFVVLSFLANGAIAIEQKYQAMSVHAGDLLGYLTIAFMVASILAIVVFAYFTVVKKEKVELELTPKVGVSIAICGLIMAALYLVVTKAMSLIALPIVLVVNNGLSLIILTVIDVLFFKQKLKTSQYIGIALGIVAVVILSI